MTGAPSGSSARVVKLTRALPDLHHLPFALALVVVLVGVLPWIILFGLRTILGKVGCTAAVEASIITIPTIELWGI